MKYEATSAEMRAELIFWDIPGIRTRLKKTTKRRRHRESHSIKSTTQVNENLTDKNGKVEIRKSSGSLVRTIGNGDAVNADFNALQTLVAITTVKGKVEIRKENGSLVGTIGNGDANNARWSGADLVLTTIKDEIQIRKQSGALIRTL